MANSAAIIALIVGIILILIGLFWKGATATWKWVLWIVGIILALWGIWGWMKK